jgi:hypothetical protein
MMTKLTKLFAIVAASTQAAAWGQSMPQGTVPQAQCAASAAVQRSPADAARLAQDQQVAIKYAVKFYTATMADMMDPLAADYVEHAASARRFNEINHVSSRDGARLLYETYSRLRGGGPPFGPHPYSPNSPLHLGDPGYMILTEGECVMVVAQRFLPDPQHAGKRYETLAFDAFKVNDQGKITDHWDNTTIPRHPPAWMTEPVSKLHFPPAKRPIYGSDYKEH